MTSRYRILIADDHALFRKGLQMILSDRPDLEILGEAADGLELLRQVRKLNPQIVLLDISMPHLRGLEAIPEIRSISPAVKIVVLTMHKNEEFLFEAISAGADGYVLKDDAEKDLFQAIKTVAQGKIYVSRFLAEESRQDWAQIRRGAKKLPAADPLTTPGTGSPEAHRRGQVQQGNRRSPEHQPSDGGASPGQRDGQTPGKKEHRPRQVRPPQRLRLRPRRAVPAANSGRPDPSLRNVCQTRPHPEYVKHQSETGTSAERLHEAGPP